MRFGIEVAARAKALLHHRLRDDLTDLTSKKPSSNFYSMAENLPHLVRAMKMIVSTGVPIFSLMLFLVSFAWQRILTTIL